MFKVWILILCITASDPGDKTPFTTMRAFNTLERAVLTWRNDKNTSLDRGYTAKYQLYEIVSSDGTIHEKLIQDPEMAYRTLDRYNDRMEEE